MHFFSKTGKLFANIQERNKGAQFLGAESLWGRPITAGATDSCGRRRKALTLSQVLSSIQYIYSEKPQVRTWGRQNCFLPWAPSNLVTPLLAYKCCHTVGFRFHMLQYGSIGGISSGKNSSTYLGVAKL